MFKSVETKKPDDFSSGFMLALPIFPARLQASIVGRNELNFRVRNGNGWTLILINTNYLILPSLKRLVTRTGIEPMFAA